MQIWGSLTICTRITERHGETFNLLVTTFFKNKKDAKLTVVTVFRVYDPYFLSYMYMNLVE